MSTIKGLLLTGDGVNGTGTANNVMKWQDADTATDSIITDNGSTVTISGDLSATNIAGTLSTAAQTNITSVGTLSSLAVSGNLTVDTNTLFVDAANNRVGIGTSSPSTNFHISGSGAVTARVESSGADALIRLVNTTATTGQDYYISSISTGDLVLVQAGVAERLRIDSSGNVGIGISTPSTYNGTATTKVLAIGGTTGNNGVNVISGTTSTGSYMFSDSGGNDRGGLIYFHTADLMTIHTAGSEKVRIDSSGNVGIGTSSPTVPLEVNVSGAGDVIKFTRDTGTNGALTLDFTGANSNFNSEKGGYTFSYSGSEKMRITSGGEVLVGKTAFTNSGAGLVLRKDATSGGNIRVTREDNSGTQNHIAFFTNAGTVIGTITTTTSSTAYNTSSDYRLKENVVEMTGALDRVDALKPSRFNFIADPEKTVDGFLAHQVQEVVPEAISGEKDAVDEEGNPVYQGIDQSKLVPLLVGAIKELKAEIETLKSQING